MGHDESICRRLEILVRRVGAMTQTTADPTDSGRFFKLSEAASICRHW
jgi:hypothetical protein